MDNPQRGYTLVKHDSDNLYDLTIFDNNRVVETVKNITLHRACVYDVRPVVLCRDCKYAPIGDKDDGEDQGFALEWPHDEWPEDNPCPCKCADGWYSHKPAPDFFCAAGEKREES